VLLLIGATKSRARCPRVVLLHPVARVTAVLSCCQQCIGGSAALLPAVHCQYSSGAGQLRVLHQRETGQSRASATTHHHSRQPQSATCRPPSSVPSISTPSVKTSTRSAPVVRPANRRTHSTTRCGAALSHPRRSSPLACLRMPTDAYSRVYTRMAGAKL